MAEAGGTRHQGPRHGFTEYSLGGIWRWRIPVPSAAAQGICIAARGCGSSLAKSLRKKMTERKVLDKGYVRLLSVSGPDGAADDRDPANCARVSFDAKDTRDRDDDLRLNRYLWTHGHTTPFEMIETWWEMKMPIFVARQLVRHRTASINEVSRRYVDAEPEVYFPSRWRAKAANKKQGSSPDPLHHMDEASAGVAYFSATASALATYQKMLKAGVAPEMARMVLPLSTYTTWVWHQDLRNLMHMLRLRSAPDAQWESQQYANAMLDLLRDRLPDLMGVVEPA